MRDAMTRATAFWADGRGGGALVDEDVAAPADGEVLVRTLHTGISRGTETIVLRGEVPESESVRMRAPFQSGDFPGPVKYGYLNVGEVADGDRALRGRTVFTLFPHQSLFVVPAGAVTIVPDGVPARRAVLAGAVETAINILWDAGPCLGDRITVVGAGMIGCSVARLARGIPGTDVVLVDVDPLKARVAAQLGVEFSAPADAPRDRDVVIDTSGSESGLRHALEAVATEGEVIEASWFGDRFVRLPLGADFHSRRLTIRSSQVGTVSARRRATRTTGDRLALGLELLRDPAFDALLTAESPWQQLPDVMTALAAGSSQDLCHTFDWRDAA
jgi:NADPH:quinone reductase-like Zn-dependent oxidoreductase